MLVKVFFNIYKKQAYRGSPSWLEKKWKFLVPVEHLDLLGTCHTLPSLIRRELRTFLGCYCLSNQYFMRISQVQAYMHEIEVNINFIKE